MQTFLAIPANSDIQLRTNNSKFCPDVIIYQKEEEIHKDKKVVILRDDEKILSCSNINEINKFCIKSGEWLIKDNTRLRNASQSAKIAPIIVETNKNLHPCILDKTLQYEYEKKDYVQFANLAEQYFFENGFYKDLFLLYYQSVILFFKLDKHKEAQDKLSLLLNKNDSLAEGWCLLGDFLVHKKIFHEAKRAYALAIQKGQTRDIYDDLPVWPKKYEKYPKEKIQEIDKLMEETKVISVDNF
jgi:hypothetical protein